MPRASLLIGIAAGAGSAGFAAAELAGKGLPNAQKAGRNAAAAPPFLRVHKSYMVSLDHARLVDSNTRYIQDKLIPVSDAYREAFYRLVRGG